MPCLVFFIELFMLLDLFTNFTHIVTYLHTKQIPYSSPKPNPCKLQLLTICARKLPMKFCSWAVLLAVSMEQDKVFVQQLQRKSLMALEPEGSQRLRPKPPYMILKVPHETYSLRDSRHLPAHICRTYQNLSKPMPRLAQAWAGLGSRPCFHVSTEGA